MAGLRYKQIRPYLLCLLLLVGAAILGGIAYIDFTTPPEVGQPNFAITSVSSAKKTEQEKAAYSVPPTHPKNLIINKLKISANIIALGILKNGAMDTPKTAWDVGWYSSSSQPGTPGAIVLDGHVNDALYSPGIFYDLHMLQPGDAIQIQRGDDTILTYEVKNVEQTSASNLDMRKVLSSFDTSKEGLNIITCGGTYSKETHTYSDRVVVYAARTP